MRGDAWPAGSPAGGAATAATWRSTSGWRSSYSSPGSCPAMHPRVARCSAGRPSSDSQTVPHDMPAPSLGNNDANVLVVGIDAAGLARQRVGGHETPHRGHSSRRWSAEAQGDEYQQARWQPDQHLQIERIPPRRLNRYLEPLRSSATCAKGGPHSGYRHLADKDEAAGSSPARPTTPALTSPNAGPRLRSLLGGANSGSRTLTWLPVLVMRQAV
jgi:hypothetical protein